MMDAPGKARLDSAVACSGVSKKAIRGNLIRRTTKPKISHEHHPDGHAPPSNGTESMTPRFSSAPAIALHHRSDFSTNSQVPKGKKY